MEIVYRSHGNVDPLGAVLLTLTDNHATTPEAALMRAWDGARKYNRSKARDAKPCVTLQCGDLLLEVATGKLRSLTGPTPAPLVAQNDLPLADRKQPNLF